MRLTNNSLSHPLNLSNKKGEIMKKKIIVLSIALATTAVTSSAIADAKTGLVFGGQFGYAKAGVDWTQSSSANTPDINKGNLFYGATLGMDVAVMPMLSLGGEVGLFYSNNLSKITSGSGTVKVSNLIVPVLAKVQITTPIGFNVFAKGGVSYVRPSASKSGSTYSIDWKSDWNFTAAAGVGYQIGAINIFAQYMRIFGKDEVNVNATSSTGYSSNIDAITGGVTYTF